MELLKRFNNYKYITDYLYIYDVILNTNELLKISEEYLYKKGENSIGEYIICDYPTYTNNQLIFPLRYIEILKQSNYEYPLELPRKKIKEYLKADMSYLGGGLYGKVYKSGNYAIKVFDNLDLYDSPYFDSSYLRETSTMLRLSHPNIITLIDIVEGSPLAPNSNDKLSIVMPAAFMNLHDYLNKHGNKYKEYITHEIIKAVSYTHLTLPTILLV